MNQEVQKTDTRDVKGSEQSRNVQHQPRSEVHLRPPVDIYEDDRALTLKADLPGVSRDQLSINVEGRTLTLEGTVGMDLSGDMTAIYADLRSNRFRRSFTLSNELQDDSIDAQLHDGVLTLTIPKREELQPKRIEVKTG